MKNKSRIIARFIKALSRHGNVKRACVASGLNRQTYYYWMREDSIFNKQATKAKRIGLA